MTKTKYYISQRGQLNTKVAVLSIIYMTYMTYTYIPGVCYFKIMYRVYSACAPHIRFIHCCTIQRVSRILPYIVVSTL